VTLDDARYHVSAFMCSAHKLRTDGCATCERTREAIRLLVAEGARRANDGLAMVDGTVFVADAEAIAAEVLP